MSTEAGYTPTKGAKWGWRILLILSLLLAANGVGLYFISASPATFEQDTGFSYAEVHQTYPSVAEQIVREGQTLGTMLVVVGLMAAIASYAGLRQGSLWAWWVTGVLLVMLAYFGVRFLIMEDRADIGGFYLGLTVWALAGQLLARRGGDVDRATGKLTWR